MSKNIPQNLSLIKISRSSLSFEKSTFLDLFLIAAVILLMLPFITTFDEFLTRIVENSVLYQPIQQYIVPFLAKMIGVLLLPFGIKFTAYLDGMRINGIPIGLTWNCLGWQSLVLILLTFLTGFTGRYTKLSILEAVGIGVLGTFLVNIFRITFTALLAAYKGELFAIVFHNYFAAFITLLWLFGFWWFSYKFVLETNNANVSE